MIDKEQLAKFRQMTDYFAARKARAAERLVAVSGRYWYFAILGLKTNVEQFEFDTLAKLQPVFEPPGEVELTTALENKAIFGAIGRYSRGIHYELAVNLDDVGTDQAAFNLALWLVAAIRIRTLAEILIPVAADYSWSTIAAVPEGACRARLVEDVPKARPLADPIEVSEADLTWVLENIDSYTRLISVPKFWLAVEALSTYQFQSNERMMAAMLWAGMEALFEYQIELKFRLATTIASLLEPRGSARRDLYHKVKKLYDIRSTAVHGGSLSKTKMNEHIIEVRRLLSQLVCMFVERGKIPSEAELEDAVFS